MLFGQIANFKTKYDIAEYKIPFALNERLKKSIIIKSAEEVDERFHSRYSCVGKKYRYVINNSRHGSAIFRDYELHVPGKLNIEEMKKAIKHFEGKHDFKAFKASGGKNKNTERTIYKAELIEDDERIILEFTGGGFLYNMIRIIVGTLIDVGFEKTKQSEIPKIIESLDRDNAGKTIQPQGLFLVKVYYDEKEMQKDIK